MSIMPTVVKIQYRFRRRPLAILSAGLLVALTCFGGCGRQDSAQRARHYADQSDAQYQRAIKLYQKAIGEGIDTDRLHFELGCLYYRNGDFSPAVEELLKSSHPLSKRFLALSFYRLGRYSDALEVFEHTPRDDDDEYLYYYGLTCEKLNLFDQALKAYKKITATSFLTKAAERIGRIEKDISSGSIDDTSPEIAELLRNAPSETDYPQAGALILLAEEEVEVSPQDNQITTLHYLIKILNERGKEDFSESHIDYDSTYEKVELQYARTIRPDGRVVEVGSRHMRDVSRYLNFPLYSNARVHIISFPEITEGAVVEYKVKIYRSQLINKKDFVLSYPLQAGEPIITQAFCIGLPQERGLYIKPINERYNTFGARLKPKVENRDGRTTYRWRFENTPQIIPETNMPPQVEINPALLVSTFQGWQDVYDWWWHLAQDKIKADGGIQEKVRELIGQETGEEARARAIYNFCAQKIRYVAVEYGQAGYEPHRAEDIFRNKYGDCKDQAILLVTMLKEAGIAAWPVLIPTKEYYSLQEDFPSALFNHCIAAAVVEGEVIFMDPTAETCAFGDLPVDDQDRQVLVVKEDGWQIQRTPIFAAEHNLVHQALAIRVNSDESIRAEKTVLTRGMYDQAQRYWLLYTPPELIEESLKEKIQDVSVGARLIEHRITNAETLDKPIELRYSFSGPEYFVTAGSLRILPTLVSLDASIVAKDERTYPIDLGVLDVKETFFDIEFPGDFTITYVPADFRQESPWLLLETAYGKSTGRITLRQKMVVKKQLITQEEYPAFKAFFEGLAKHTKQRVVLQRLDKR